MTTRVFASLCILLSLAGAQVGTVGAELTKQKKKAPQSRLVIIVNPAVKPTSIKLAELTRILKMQKKRWPGKSRVYLVLPKDKSPASKVLLANVYKMSERRLRKYWAKMIYTNKITSRPKAWEAGKAIAFVAKKKGAMAVVMQNEIPGGAKVKVLAIDGNKPDSKGYPFK